MDVVDGGGLAGREGRGGTAWEGRRGAGWRRRRGCSWEGEEGDLVEDPRQDWSANVKRRGGTGSGK